MRIGSRIYNSNSGEIGFKIVAQHATMGNQGIHIVPNAVDFIFICSDKCILLGSGEVCATSIGMESEIDTHKQCKPCILMAKYGIEQVVVAIVVDVISSYIALRSEVEAAGLLSSFRYICTLTTKLSYQRSHGILTHFSILIEVECSLPSGNGTHKIFVDMLFGFCMQANHIT